LFELEFRCVEETFLKEPEEEREFEVRGLFFSVIT